MRPPLGILVLDTSFARPRGDVANPASWDFPVLLHVVAGATARRAVSGDETMLDDFVTAAEALVAQGAVGIVTSCGFLAVWQEKLASLVSVPVASSALLQLPLVQRCLGARRRAGVITYDAACLTPAHFAAVGADPGTPVGGLPPDGAFRGVIERGARYDVTALAQEVLTAARELLADAPDIGAIVLECTNLPPFSEAIRVDTGLPVYDVITLGSWFRAGLPG